MVVKSIPDWKAQISVNLVYRTTVYPFKTVRKVLGKIRLPGQVQGNCGIKGVKHKNFRFVS